MKRLFFYHLYNIITYVWNNTTTAKPKEFIFNLALISMEQLCEYDGERVGGRFEGVGTYISSKGKYIGSFFNGVFHGEGTLYVKGGRFYGDWDHGQLISGSFIYDDELTYQGDEKGWTYCTNEDPRFFSEICEGIEPNGPLKYPTPSANPPVLPEGCYDMIIGYYDPKNHSIKAYGTDEEIRRPTQEEKNWMVENCRFQAPPGGDART